jgi:hypothetical protein
LIPVEWFHPQSTLPMDRAPIGSVVIESTGSLGQSLGGLGQRSVAGGSAIWLFLFIGAR